MQLRVGFTPEPQITPRVSNTKQSHEDLRKLARRATEMSSHAKPSVGSRSAISFFRPDAGYVAKRRVAPAVETRSNYCDSRPTQERGALQ